MVKPLTTAGSALPLFDFDGSPSGKALSGGGGGGGTSVGGGGRGLLRNRATLVWGLRFGLVVLVIWCEVGEFFSSISPCHFPDSLLRQSALAASPGSAPPVPSHVLLLADPQVPHPVLSYPDSGPLARTVRTWLSDLYMRKSWNVVMQLGRIDAVIVAGDMMDWGGGVLDDEEYARYLERFRSIFRLPPGVPMHFVPGNQDVGLGPHWSFSPYSKERYATSFSPPNALLPIANHTFILLDAISLVEEDYRRYAAEVQLGEWEGIQGGVIEFVKTLGDDPPPAPRILVSHIPLARPESANCGSLRERGNIKKGAGIGYQNLLGSETSKFLLDQIKPAIIYSGDDHDYCEYWHPSGVREVTLKSFSPNTEIKRPGFQLLSLIPPSQAFSIRPQRTFADVPCFLPSPSEIYFRHYVPAFVLVVGMLFWLNFKSVAGGRGGGAWSALPPAHRSPDPGSASPSPNINGYAWANGSSSSRKEKPLPLVLPSRKSSQNLGLMMSPSAPMDPSRSVSRSPSHGSMTPIRRVTKSAPVSPLQSPRVEPAVLHAGDADAESGLLGGHDAIYMTRSGMHRTRTVSNEPSWSRDPSGEFSDEPGSYFLLPGPVTGRGESQRHLGVGTPSPSPMSGQRRPSSSVRKLSSRPSDWVSAARAKDMTVIDLVFSEAPGMSGAKAWFGWNNLRRIGRWLGGRHGVLARTLRDTLKIAWMPIVVWGLLNVLYFV